ncbi:MAG: hypothetical protein KDN19_07010 [Verrucomicrobiae bacterium]|nr:hypothetical protein [Verrucomicrobiae bacterium]
MPSSNLHLTDFSDRLSPMLVKELRQGMRTHLFTIAFILLQAFMVLCVLIGASAPGDPQPVSAFFWFFVVATLLIVMPIRGFGALTSEMQLNTMDLIQLTRLGAWRMTFGKWAALVAQSLLLACGILPYLVMRYFFGGVDVITEMIILFWVLVASMIFTAITVGFSAFRSVLLRATVSVALFIGVLFGLQLIDELAGTLIPSGGGSAPAGTVVRVFVGGLLCSAYAIWFMLDLGASRIAPEADNHATRKRLGALAFGVTFLLLPLAGFNLIACTIITGIVWMLVSLDALTERPTLLPSLMRPFAARWYLRPFFIFLAPGWPSGLFFYLLCAGLFGAALWFHGGGAGLTLQETQIMVSCGALVVFPLIFIHLFFRKITEPASIFGIYLLVQVCFGVIALFLMVIAEATHMGDVAFLIVPLPATTLFAAISGSGHAEKALVLAAAAIGLIAIIITIFRGMSWYRDAYRIMNVLRRSHS